MKKTYYINPKFYHKILNLQLEKEKALTPIFCRNTTLFPVSIGHTFNVYNGKKYIKVFVSEDIIGHKLGEFSGSRSRYFFKKAKKKKKK